MKQAHIIGVINEKGGVGKSTIASHLAIWNHQQGNQTALLDADGQQSSSRWVAEAEPGIEVRAFTNPDDLFENADDLSRNHDIIVADGPANGADGSRVLMLAADIVVVPVGPTMLDMESTRETIRILANARKVRQMSGGVGPKALVVLNRLRNKKYTQTREAFDAAQTLGEAVCPHALSTSDYIGDASGQRTTVWQMGYRAKRAATQMLSVIEEITQYGKQNAPKGETIEGSEELRRKRDSQRAGDEAGTREPGDPDSAEYRIAVGAD